MVDALTARDETPKKFVQRSRISGYTGGRTGKGLCDGWSRVMTDLGMTLKNMQDRMGLPGMKLPGSAGGTPTGRLTDFADSGANPGNLRARIYVPQGLQAGAPLVVVLHGCTQTADGYDHGSGWSQLAQEHGFALLFPEQQRANNPNLCFNWFSASDSRRGAGEALSIQQMIEAMIRTHAINRSRIYVTGLSAGGAMTSIMLATYPEIFAGGAIIAGLPYGSATGVGDAMARIRGEGYPSHAELAAHVRSASDFRGPWPSVSVWHGSADAVVDKSNADRIVGQWLAVHGLAATRPEQDRVDGCERQVWRDAAGRAVITSYEIDGMGHGMPLDTKGADAAGSAGPYMLEAGISSTRHIARSWGLLGEAERSQARARAEAGEREAPRPRASAPEPLRALVPARPVFQPQSDADHEAAAAAGTRHMHRATMDIQATIEGALRKAGLMR